MIKVAKQAHSQKERLTDCDYKSYMIYIQIIVKYIYVYLNK